MTQTQYCLPDGNDRCIMMMTVAMDGIPYSDVFAVEVRWAARRIGNCDIVIDAGVFVRFLKSSMFANKIKSGTLTETKPIHLDLFEVVKLAIASDQESTGDLEVETEEETETLAIMTPSVKEEEKADKDIMQQLTNIFQNFASAAIQSPQYVQIMAVVVSMFFLYLVFRKKSVHEPQSIDDLARKVDQMTVEMMEMKAMLESIIKLMGEHRNERDEL